MRRVLKCDGLLPQKMNAAGQFETVTPEDIRAMKEYIDANRTLTTPFDIVVEGKTGEMAPGQVQEKLTAWKEAGATWWVEGDMGSLSFDALRERVRRGPPV